MRFYEYEAREIVRRAGIPVTRYGFTRDAAEAAEIAARIGGPVVVKSQVPLANEVFTPDAHVIDRTRRIVAAMREAAGNGSGAVSLDGRLIDAASIRMAETLLAKLEQIEAKERGAAPAAPALRAVAGEARPAAARVLSPFADI